MAILDHCYLYCSDMYYWYERERSLQRGRDALWRRFPTAFPPPPSASLNSCLPCTQARYSSHALLLLPLPTLANPRVDVFQDLTGGLVWQETRYQTRRGLLALIQEQITQTMKGRGTTEYSPPFIGSDRYNRVGCPSTWIPFGDPVHSFPPSPCPGS